MFLSQDASSNPGTLRSLRSNLGVVPVFQTSKRQRLVFNADFVDEEVRRRRDPRQVTSADVADVADELSSARFR